jgi:hypothetical protein
MSLRSPRSPQSAGRLHGTGQADSHRFTQQQRDRYLKQFRLDPFPVFTYEIEGIEIEKSVFMIQGESLKHHRKPESLPHSYLYQRRQRAKP